MSTPATIEIREGIGRVRMDDGKVNAISHAMLEALGAAFDRAEAEGVTAVVIEGRDELFSAGFDLKTFAKGGTAGPELVFAGARFYERMLRFPRPIVTVCRGYAYPAGAFLLLAADVRFAAAGASPIGMNEVAIGLTVPRFAIELARHRLTPAGFAAISTATLFGTEEAARAGYVDHVVAPEALGAAVEAEVERLRGLDANAYAGTKARLNGEALARIGAAIDQEAKEVGIEV